MAFNAGKGISAGISAASTGGTVGSAFGPVGTAIGTGIGALAGFLGGGLSGNVKKDKRTGLTANQMQQQGVNQNGFGQTPNKYNSLQQQALNSALSQGQTNLQNPYAGFEPIETYAQNKFRRESIPSLSERFTSLGGSGTRPGRDLENQLNSAQSQFDVGLAALRSQYGQQNQQNALQMLQLGLSPQTEQIYFGETPSLGSQLFETGGNLLGSYLQGGGDFGVADYRNNKTAKMEALQSKKGTFAKQLAMKRMQAGGV